MTGEVDICNQALSRLGGQRIISLDDNTNEALMCRNSYNPIRRVLLSEYPWTFAVARFIITPLAGDYPEYGDNKVFPKPRSVLNILTVTSSVGDIRVNDLEWQAEGENIIAKIDRIYVKATADIYNTSLFSALFKQAFVVRLAAEMAVALTGSTTKQTALFQEYGATMNEAAVRDGQQGRTTVIRSPRYRNVRNGGGLL